MSSLNIEGPIASPMSQSPIEGSTKPNQKGSIKGHSIRQNFRKFASHSMNKIKSLFSSHVSKSTTGEQGVKSKHRDFSAKVTKSKGSELTTNPKELTADEKEKCFIRALKQAGLA